jgi:hypothetical protein
MDLDGPGRTWTDLDGPTDLRTYGPTDLRTYGLGEQSFFN